MRNRILIALAVLLVAGLASAQGVNTGVIYTEQGGARKVIPSGASIDIESGGEVDVESGGSLKIAGTAVTSTAAELNILDTVTVTAVQLNKIARSSFNICGDATTVNNNTVYYGPSITLLANTSGGQTCDINAAGNTTEATADAPIYTSQAVAVLGMTCRNEGDAGADISFTLRTAAGATVPSVTCTISDNDRDCVADVQTTTDVAAAATVAVAVASTGDIGDGEGFVCQVFTAY